MAALSDESPRISVEALTAVRDAACQEFALARYYQPAIAQGVDAGEIAGSSLAVEARIFWCFSRSLLSASEAGYRPKTLVENVASCGTLAEMPQLARPAASTLQAARARFYCLPPQPAAHEHGRPA